MSPAVAVTIGLALALLAAGAWAAWVWTTRRARFEVHEGLTILSNMRWRELSNLVVDALAASGFDRESAEQQARRGASGDVIVYRDGQPWVLTCRQGLATRVTRESVVEFARGLRGDRAFGGLIVTPGRVDADARVAAPNVELVDGDELWKLVGPLLPVSVDAEIAMRARARALRSAGAALAAGAIGGIVLGIALAKFAGEEESDATLASTTPVVRRATPRPVAPQSPATTTAPMSEDEQREAIVHEMAQLPGVDRALWSTRSTLQVFLNDPEVATDAALCAVMKRYDLLRASRLQLQSPSGATRPVRFMQCAVY